MTDNNLTPIDEIKKKYEQEQGQKAAVVVRDGIKDISQKIITEVNKDVADKKLSYSDAAKDIAGAVVTSQVFDQTDKDNEKFIRKTKRTKQQEITEDFIAKKIKATADKLANINIRAEAFYKHWRPILEFDLSNLVSTKKDEPPKTYADRAYGIPLMVIMLLLLSPFYCVFVMILSAFNGINAIFRAIDNFGAIARRVCFTILIIAFMALLAYLIIYGLDHFFGIEIFNKV